MVPRVYPAPRRDAKACGAGSVPVRFMQKRGALDALLLEAPHGAEVRIPGVRVRGLIAPHRGRRQGAAVRRIRAVDPSTCPG
jgi:hypothetical protein